MTVITAHIRVAPDHTISGVAPEGVPPGDHTVTIQLLERPPRQEPVLPFDVNALPVHDFGPWPENLSLRREDIYGEDGR